MPMNGWRPFTAGDQRHRRDHPTNLGVSSPDAAAQATRRLGHYNTGIRSPTGKRACAACTLKPFAG
jgi:hypothetical protein